MELVQSSERARTERQGEQNHLSMTIAVSAVMSEESEDYEQSPRESAIYLGKGCEGSRLNSPAFWASLVLAGLCRLRISSNRIL